jgi:hypothetical protein
MNHSSKTTTLLAVALALGLMPSVAGQAPQEGEGKEYEYRPNLKREVMLYRGGKVYIGRLDEQGNFIWDSPVTPRKLSDPGVVKSPGPLINKPANPPGPAYEYRSRTLVKGVIDDKGNFIPEAGSKITAFKDYRYKPGAIPIYNLPGSFVEKKSDSK